MENQNLLDLPNDILILIFTQPDMNLKVLALVCKKINQSIQTSDFFKQLFRQHHPDVQFPEGEPLNQNEAVKFWRRWIVVFNEVKKNELAKFDEVADETARGLHQAVYRGAKNQIVTGLENDKNLLDKFNSEPALKQETPSMFTPTTASPLSLARKLGRLEILKTVYEHYKKTLDKDNETGSTKLLLTYACQLGLIHEMEKFNIDSKAATDLLEIACKNSDSKLVDFLIKKGADVNKDFPSKLCLVDKYNFPLFIAVSNNDISTVKVLIEAKADVNKAKELLVSISIIKKNLDMTHLLLKHGAYFGKENSGSCIQMPFADSEFNEAVKKIIKDWDARQKILVDLKKELNNYCSGLSATGLTWFGSRHYTQEAKEALKNAGSDKSLEIYLRNAVSLIKEKVDLNNLTSGTLKNILQKAERILDMTILPQASSEQNQFPCLSNHN